MSTMRKYLSRLLPALLFVFLVSCHSGYITLNYKVIPSATIARDSTGIFFVVRKMAYFQAKGASRMPDGGQPKYLLNELSLYKMDPGKQTLDELYIFSDLQHEKVNLKVELQIIEDNLNFKVYPNTDWEVYINNASSDSRKDELLKLRRKYNDSVTYKIVNSKILKSDIEDLSSTTGASLPVSLTYINEELEHIKLSALGLNIETILPRSADDYIDECIYLKNDSPISRRAIIEQIISDLPEEEIRILLRKMDDYANNLNGIEKTEYETYSKNTYDKIKALL